MVLKAAFGLTLNSKDIFTTIPKQKILALQHVDSSKSKMLLADLDVFEIED